MVILQSYCSKGGKRWVYECMQSVEKWAAYMGYDYKVYDDEDVLSTLPAGALGKIGKRWAILNDYARLAFCKSQLEHHEEVVWLDADVFIHDYTQMRVSCSELFFFGSELWVHEDLLVKKGIHNAVCYFKRGNPFLEFYLYACERLLMQFSGGNMSPQFLGPKLLKHYDGLLKMPKSDSVTMMSPVISQALISGEEKVLSLQHDFKTAGAVNLCNSLVSDEVAERVILKLRQHGKEMV